MVSKIFFFIYIYKSIFFVFIYFFFNYCFTDFMFDLSKTIDRLDNLIYKSESLIDKLKKKILLLQD